MSDPPAPTKCPDCGLTTLHAAVLTSTEIQEVETWEDGTVFVPVDAFEHPDTVDIHLSCRCGWTSGAKAWAVG